jgi:5'(3')-deoxyribonucleotidase
MSKKVFCRSCRYIETRVDDQPKEWESYDGRGQCHSCHHFENEVRGHLSSWYEDKEVFIGCKLAPSDINGNNDCPFYKPLPG